MKKTLKVIAIVFCVVTTVLGSRAQDTPMRKLLSSPDDKTAMLFFGQRLNTRLDMMDYYDASSKAFCSDDMLGSKIRIDSLAERYVRFATDTPLTIESYLLTPGNDSLLVTVVTMPVGNADANVVIDDITTGKTIGSIKLRYSDWLVKDALKAADENTLAANIPFVTATAFVDPEKNTVTFTNTAITTPGLNPYVTALFKPELVLRWNGKKFTL